MLPDMTMQQCIAVMDPGSRNPAGRSAGMTGDAHG